MKMDKKKQGSIKDNDYISLSVKEALKSLAQFLLNSLSISTTNQIKNIFIQMIKEKNSLMKFLEQIEQILAKSPKKSDFTGSSG